MLTSFFLAGLVGVIYHCFHEMGKLNKQQNGNFNFKTYIRLERFNIITSVLGVFIAVLCGSFIKKLMSAEYYLVPAFICIGFFGESVIIAAFGKASDVISTFTGRKIEVEQTLTTTITETPAPPVETKDDTGLTS